jgi:AcrR family transcriptional regulator
MARRIVREMRRPAEAEPPPADNALCDRIVGAAFETIMKKGYWDTSMLDIATRAKVSKRDLYAMYPNKQAVLVAVITSRAARMQLAPDLPPPHSRAVLAATLNAYGATVVREVCQPAVIAMYRLGIAEAARSPAIAEVLAANRTRSRQAIGTLLAEAQAAGILAEGDPQAMTERYFALLWGDLLLNRLFGRTPPPKPAEIEQQAREATEALLALYGSAAKPGTPP